MKRRVLITAAAALPATAGCLNAAESPNGGSENEGSNESNISEAESTENELESEVPDTDPCDDVETIAALGNKSGISIETTSDRDYEYIDDKEQVRVTYDDGTTAEMSFGRLATKRAASEAAERVIQLLEAEGMSDPAVGGGRVRLDEITEEDPNPDEFKRAVPSGVRVLHTKSYSQNGHLLSEPDVDFQEVVDVLPRTITVDIAFENHDYTAKLPVMCERACSIEE